MATTVEDNGNDYFAACLRFQGGECDCVWSKGTMAKHGGRGRYCFIGKCAGGATYWQRRWRSAYLLLALASSSAGLVHWPPFQPFQLVFICFWLHSINASHKKHISYFFNLLHLIQFWSWKVELNLKRKLQTFVKSNVLGRSSEEDFELQDFWEKKKGGKEIFRDDRDSKKYTWQLATKALNVDYEGNMQKYS